MTISRFLFTGLTAMMIFSGQSQAKENWKTLEVTSQPFVVNEGEIRTLPLPNTMNVYKLFVQAESAGPRNAMFDVVVNGDVKGTIMTPGIDPTYIVTVDQTTSSVQFRSASGGAFRILRVLAVMTPENENAEDVIGRLLPNRNDLTAVAVEAIALIRQMEPDATPDEELMSLLPIKAAAGRLYAVAAARGQSSGQTRQAAIDLIASIDAAKPFFDQQMEKDGSFDCIVDLLALRAKLDALID